MPKRKRITPLQRARQAASRVNALQAVSGYERKMVAKRTASVKAALHDLRNRGVPPERWADEVQYAEPWMLPLLTDLYRTTGMISAVEVANRLLSRKDNPTDVFARAILQWAQEHLGKRITLMTDTVSRWLRDTLSDIFAEHSDEGVEKLTALMEKEAMGRFGDVRQWQVRRICQTEAMHGMNVAGSVAADALGLDYEKTWSIAGINTRPTHEEVDGITVGKGELFSVGGYPMDYPTDDSHGAPAGDVINCSCTLIYLPRGNGLSEI